MVYSKIISGGFWFIQMEMPKRYARRIHQIESLRGWQAVPELVRVRETLFDAFRQVRLAEPWPSQGCHSSVANLGNLLFTSTGAILFPSGFIRDFIIINFKRFSAKIAIL